MLSPSYIKLRIQTLRANSVDLDEVAHYEPPHQDLRCLQIQLFSSLVFHELTLKARKQDTVNAEFAHNAHLDLHCFAL